MVANNVEWDTLAENNLTSQSVLWGHELVLRRCSGIMNRLQQRV